jgi:hypothetical protein
MLAGRQVTAVISRNGEPHRGPVLRGAGQVWRTAEMPSSIMSHSGIADDTTCAQAATPRESSPWQPPHLSKLDRGRARVATWNLDPVSALDTNTALSPDLATPLTPDSVLTTSPDLSSPPPYVQTRS